jgi:hypothetical protein
MESGNELVISADGEIHDELGPVYRVVHFSLMAATAIQVAKLFEDLSLQYRNANGYNTTDKASLAVLIYFLRQHRCQRDLAQRARNWQPTYPDMADYWQTECERAASKAVKLYSAFRQSPRGRKAMTSLKEIRDHALAHSLTRSKKTEYPKYDQIFHLIEVAVGIVENAQLAVEAQRPNFRDDDTAHYRSLGARFWSHALVVKI